MKRLVHECLPARATLLVAATFALAACASPRGPSSSVSLAGDQPVAQAQPEEWDYVADDGVRHYVTEFGRGDTVVVLHGGWGGDHGGLVDAVRPLTDRFHFVLYDQRGSLRSPAAETTISLPRLVRDLDGLRRALGQERLTLFAHSMGTALAYAYLAEHPERVAGLVLAAALLPTADAYRDLAVPASDTARLAQLRRALGEAQGARRATTLAAERLDRPDSVLTDRERAAKWRAGLAARMLARPERWRFLRGGPSFYNPRVGEAISRNSTSAERDSLWGRFLPALARFTGPVTVIVGDQDFIDPQGALWTHAIARLPRVRLEVLRGAGHSAWIDEPTRFSALAAEGLARSTNKRVTP